MTAAFDDDDAAAMVEALSFDVEAVVNGAVRFPVLFEEDPAVAFNVVASTGPMARFSTALWPDAARGDIFDIDGVRWRVVKVDRNARSRVTSAQLEKAT